MFTPIIYMQFYCIPVLFQLATCTGAVGGSLKISSPGELEYAAVIVKLQGDNLTLDCTYQSDSSPRLYVWNFVPANSSVPSDSEYNISLTDSGSRLTRSLLTPAHSGHYVCSAPPHSASKTVLVQTRGQISCARGAFRCGVVCVLGGYVCDGYRDCRQRGEDEATALCGKDGCNRPDMLNCSNGRCIPSAACCSGGGSLCRQPACCEEHPQYARHEGYLEEYPPLYEDRRAPDEYGFIQSTIYTVTACALIFMIAVVLLVSAICKMHMKRAALNSHHRQRYTQQPYAQALRFPPCYETSRLLERERALSSPSRAPDDVTGPDSGSPVHEGGEPPLGLGLTRLSALWGRPQYTQAPTCPPDVELRSLPSSPTRDRTRAPMQHYRSPAYTGIDEQLYFSADSGSCGRELNYMATPVELYRSRTLRSNLDRVIGDSARPRPLTLQLGRFQLSIPLLGRRPSSERRPDTPNVAELNIDDLDFVRLNSNDTYTLNGRTIRLLGANFENYPLLNDDNQTRPPPYTEAVRYKLYGPPPEYLSRDALNDGNGNGNRQNNDNSNGNVIPSPVTATEQQARSNIEEPPCYEDLASGVDTNANNVDNGIDNEVNNENNVTIRPHNNNNDDTPLADCERSDNVIPGSNAILNSNSALNSSDDATNNVVQNLNSVIDNLPAIDSDVNANETEVRYSVTNNSIGNNSYNNNVC